MRRSLLALVIMSLSLAGCGGESLASAAPSETTTNPPAAPNTPVPTPTLAAPKPTLVVVTPEPEPSDTTDESDEPADIVLVGYGFTYFPGSTPTASYGIVINNPNPNTWVGSVSMNITFLGPDGSVVGSEDEYIWTALPGKMTGIGDTAFPDSKVTKMEVTLDTEWTEIDYEPGAFSFSKVKTTSDQYSTETKGLITSSFSEKQDSVQVNAIYRNKSGRIVGGDFTYVNNVAAGRSTSFKLSTLDKIPGVTKTELYGNP